MELCLRHEGTREESWLECETGEHGREIWWRYRSPEPGSVTETAAGPRYGGRVYAENDDAEDEVLRALAGSFVERPEIGERSSWQWYHPAGSAHSAGRRQTLLGRSEEDGAVIWCLLEPIDVPVFEGSAAAQPPLPQAAAPATAAAVAAPGFPYALLSLIAAIVALLLHLALTWPGLGTLVHASGPFTSRDAANWISEPFTLRSGAANLEGMLGTDLSNSWARADICLINVETRRRYCVARRVEYYYGREGGESWAEGGQSATVYLSAVPAGTYRLQLHLEAAQDSSKVWLTLRRDVPRHRYLLMALLLLSMLPVLRWSVQNPMRQQDGSNDRHSIPLILLLAYGFLIYLSWP